MYQARHLYDSQLLEEAAGVHLPACCFCFFPPLYLYNERNRLFFFAFLDLLWVGNTAARRTQEAHLELDPCAGDCCDWWIKSSEGSSFSAESTSWKLRACPHSLFLSLSLCSVSVPCLFLFTTSPGICKLGCYFPGTYTSTPVAPVD